jgi:hypothetical protein
MDGTPPAYVLLRAEAASEQEATTNRGVPIEVVVITLQLARLDTPRLSLH